MFKDQGPGHYPPTRSLPTFNLLEYTYTRAHADVQRDAKSLELFFLAVDRCRDTFRFDLFEVETRSPGRTSVMETYDTDLPVQRNGRAPLPVSFGGRSTSSFRFSVESCQVKIVHWSIHLMTNPTKRSFSNCSADAIVEPSSFDHKISEGMNSIGKMKIVKAWKIWAACFLPFILFEVVVTLKDSFTAQESLPVDGLAYHGSFEQEDQALSMIELNNEDPPEIKQNSTWLAIVSDVPVSSSLIKIYSTSAIQSLAEAFYVSSTHLYEQFKSLWQWISDRSSTYEYLTEDAKLQYDDLNLEVSLLIRQRNSIERLCLNPGDDTTRSLCIQTEMDCHDGLMKVLKQRSKAKHVYEQLKKRVVKVVA